MAREEFDIYNYVHKNKFKLDVKQPKTVAYKTPTNWMPLNEVKIVNGKFSVMESLEATNRPLAGDVKKHFLEIISTYNSFGEQMKRNSDIVDMAETLGGVIDAAKTLTLQEADDWFDKVTIKRNMSELDKLDKSFDKVAKEARALDNRLSALYEDMGNILGRYYEISDVDPEVMRQRLALKTENTSYTIKVKRDGNTLGKTTVSKANLKEAVSKLKTKYVGSTITVLNESGKVVKTIQNNSHTLNEQVYKYGFDLTDISAREWAKMLKQFKLPSKPKLQNSKWHWQAKDGSVLVVAANDPISGKYGAGSDSREDETDYASYIGIEGNVEIVKQIADFIKKYGQSKGYSAGRRSFI